MARILLNTLRKSYAGQEVIHGITMDIANGEFVVIVGPSGCGKSTLLRMVAGLEGISSGTIEINDRVVNDLEPRERDIAMVFQNYALYPHMSVRENMAYGLKIAKMPKAEIAERVARAATMLELEPYLEYHFTKVGQQTRDMLDSYIHLGERHGLPTDNLRQLREGLA